MVLGRSMTVAALILLQFIFATENTEIHRKETT